jgi:hypothetical protein
MEISPGEEEIKKLSGFLSEMHIAHYVHEFSLHIPGEATYVSFDDPMEIRVEQNNGEVIRVLKTVEEEGDNVQVETWKGLDSVIFNIKSKGVEVVYHGGELEIRFLY